MYVYVYSIDTDGSMYKSYRAKPPASLDPKAACLYAMADYLRGYLEDYGADMDEVIVNTYPSSCEIRFESWDGEPGRMYFTTEVPTS